MRCHQSRHGTLSLMTCRGQTRTTSQPANLPVPVFPPPRTQHVAVNACTADVTDDAKICAVGFVAATVHKPNTSALPSRGGPHTTILATQHTATPPHARVDGNVKERPSMLQSERQLCMCCCFVLGVRCSRGGRRGSSSDTCWFPADKAARRSKR